jgi:hypothetical protein
MKKTLFCCLIVALYTMPTTVYAQLTIGEQYKIYSEANPSNAIYMTGNPGDNARFAWDLADAGDYFKVNSVAGQDANVFQFEWSPTAYLKASGGGLSPCNTYGDINYDFTWWRLIPDDDPVGGVQYYIVQHVMRPTRFMYFNPDDFRVYTNEVGEDGPAYDANRKYYRVTFERSSAPSVSLSVDALAFSSAFLSKTFKVSGTNITGDITFVVPPGISVSGANVVNNTIPAAQGNGDNTVTLTVNSYDRDLNDVLAVTTPGALSTPVITLRGGLKTGVWYNLSLLTGGFGIPVNLGDSVGADGLSYVAAVVPDATVSTQAFSFLPVTYAGDEAFFVRNAVGNYLAANEDDYRDVVWHPALVGSEYEEWSLSGQLVTTAINYFEALTLRTGRTSAPGYYLGLNSDAITSGVRIAAHFSKDWARGTFKLSEVQAVVINYVDANGKELKLPRVVLTGLTVDATYTASASDKANIVVGGQTWQYNAAASTDHVVVGLGNAVINLVFSNTVGIKDIGTAARPLVYANGQRQIVVAAVDAGLGATVSVYNLTGQRVDSRVLNASGAAIDVPEGGVYLVTVRSKGVAETYKVVLK